MLTLSEHVTQTLRNWILDGRFKPGERIEEIPAAELLGVSRTPVRSALSLLASEGLLDYQAKRGYLVRAFDLDVILAAYEVRSVLEGLACRRAALRGLNPDQAQRLADCLALGDQILAKGRLMPEDHAPYQKMNVTLHNTLLEAAGNPWLDRFVDQAHQIPYASDRVVLWDVEHAVILRSHGDHHRIVEAVRERDALRAEQLMREHVYYAGVILKNNYRQMAQGADGASTSG